MNCERKLSEISLNVSLVDDCLIVFTVLLFISLLLIPPLPSLLTNEGSAYKVKEEEEYSEVLRFEGRSVIVTVVVVVVDDVGCFGGEVP